MNGLTKKQITDKNDKRTYVWVKNVPRKEGDPKVKFGATQEEHDALRKESKGKSESKLSEAQVEGVKGQFLRAKNAYKGAENDADKKKAAQALQGFHEQLKEAGVQKEGMPFWSKDLK